MPFNPGNENISGQIYAQGITGLANNLSNLAQQYVQNRTMAQSAIGKVEGAIQAHPEIIGFMQDPKTPPNISKYFKTLQSTGSLPVEGASALANFTDSYVQEKANATAQQLAKAQLTSAQQEQQLRKFQIERMGMMNQWMQGDDGQGGISGVPANGVLSIQGFMPQGTSQPASQGQPQQPPKASALPVNNPYGYTQNPQADTRNFVIKTLRATGQPPDAAEINAFTADRNKWLDTEQQVGFVPAGNEYDADGNATARKILPATIKPGQPGRIIVGKDAISLDPQATPSMPLIDPQTGQQLDPSKAFGGNFNPNAKGAQDELASSYDALNKSNESLSNAKFFQDAVNAFASDPATGGRMNVLLGSPKYAAVRQLFTGKNPQAQLEAAQGKMYAATIDNLRNDKTGSNGIRSMTQQELTQLQSQYGQPDMPPALQKVLADNTAAVMQKHHDMLEMYTQLRDKGMRPTDADRAVISDPRFSKSLTLNVDNPNSAAQNLVKGKVYRNPKGQRAMWDGAQWVAP